ncbi:MAG: N-acetyltransferase [Magnetospirillum sp.]|nr:N-acetyltransferase [Magnetospirillum sp.]
MPDGADSLAVSVLSSLSEVEAEQWDACAGPDNPFVAHAFLSALERSGSATGRTGWQPRPLVVRGRGGLVLAVAPLYLKSHSYGEYVFDWGWAQAYERAGGTYYPKLQCAVPFTPVTGPRLLIRPGEDRGRLTRILASSMIEAARRLGASSVHVTFPQEAEAAALGELCYLRRLGSQYHWCNQGYDGFDDFLALLSSRKRKQIRKEREAVARLGLRIETLVGADIKARHWDVFHAFYQATVDRKWGQAYVNRAFFEELAATRLGDKAVLVWAEEAGEPLGAAFNMLGSDTLYGRTWGGGRHVDFLHFEACYYRAIDFAITHGLARVEAGAQGEHKVSRGYLPTPTYSAHWIADANLEAAVARFLDHEREAVAADIVAQAEEGPFRKG